MVLLSFLADILTSATRTVVLTILPQCGRLSTGMLLNNGIINKYMEQQEKISMEDIDKIEKIFNVEYSDTVKYAVRYGYNYRIEAEQKLIPIPMLVYQIHLQFFYGLVKK